MSASFVDTNNPKSRPDGGSYNAVISQISKEGVCPFCMGNLDKYHKNPVINHTHWLVTNNMYPYKPSKHHVLFIHKEHITHLGEISPDAWSELLAISKQELKGRDVSGGTLIMRFGDTKFTGASVSHLHAHLVQSEPDSPDYDQTKGLTMRIG